MKRFVAQGLKFLLVVVVAYVVVFFALTWLRILGKPVIYRTNDYYHLKGGNAWEQHNDWAKGARYDLVVIGSSHAYRGYDPRVFRERGYRMFNLGSSAQTPLSTYAILEGLVPRERAPLVVIDVYEDAFVQAGIESVSELTRDMVDDRTAISLAADFRDLRGLNMITLRMLDKGSPPSFTDPTYVGDGAAIRRDSARSGVKYPVRGPLRIDPRQLERFIDCLDLCDQRGIQVVLSSHPYPPQADRAQHTAFVAMVDSVIATRPEDRRPRRFDLVDAPGFDGHDHFYDHTHLNQAGARAFTGMLIDSLEVKGILQRR